MPAIMESKNSIIFFWIANVTSIIMDYHNTVTWGLEISPKVSNPDSYRDRKSDRVPP
jgi:hypothetical protein